LLASRPPGTVKGMDPWRTETTAHDDDDARPVPSGRPLLCVSDIHGDIAALESVLDAAAHLDLCGIAAAGDHCLGGPDPFAVWQRLVTLGAHLTRGPSDLAVGVLRPRELSPTNAREEARLLTLLRTQEALGDIVCRRLAELPSTHVISLDDRSGVMVMHGSPADEFRGLQDDEHLPDEVGCVAEDVLVVGSTHRGFQRRIEHLLVVNAGSTGMSPVRGQRAERTAHAVLIVPCVDGVVRAYERDIPVRTAVSRVRRTG
jgi:predicted phosphodiesterase